MATIIKTKILSSIAKPRSIRHLIKEAQIKLHFMPYECLYPFYKSRFKPSATHQQFSLSSKQIYGNHRLPGTSGYYRLYNEEDFLAASVESHLPFFDELVLVHDNTVTDNTPQIAQSLADKYPDKVKYFIYEPKAYKIRTKASRILPPNHPNSFINYCNFALSKTTRQILSLVDGDLIAIQSEYAKISDNAHNPDFMQNVFYAYEGLNLWYVDNQLWVDAKNTRISYDKGFYVMRPEQHYYKKSHMMVRSEHKTTEYRPIGGVGFQCKNRQKKRAGLLCFHLKNMRSGTPYHSYRGIDDTEYRVRFKHRFVRAQKTWLDWDSFINNKKYRDIFLQDLCVDITELPDPNIYLKDVIAKIPSIKSADYTI